ncbi:hypothetical protein BCR39DRAFT_522503 [Naematelia encephala]|uniref:Transcription factor domain-containing protein n=1 Tax=Naematelia encephala TaxID=71784 RepID=A0A1Y2BCD6_9TREE|nr:hypothetical protein BCR39DRAFT_522503 [Naematelia encephala]
MLYGKSAAVAAAATSSKSSDSSNSPRGKDGVTVAIPDLTKEFFDSAFFRRFQVQRPILDPIEFVNRYCSRPVPTATAMGPEGAILVHTLYAWAVSYGVDENGMLDVPEGGRGDLEPIDLLRVSEGESARETDRQTRMEKLRSVLEIVLNEIDACGVMRKPTWDGVRSLLLILPLTEGVSTPVERLAMYEAAVSQVYTLCSFLATGYDGAPSATSAVNGGSDEASDSGLLQVRVRIYWYAFVHEGITSGLKGGRLHLDDEDLETMQDSITNRALVLNSNHFQATAKLATAPINLALACRLVNKALTGPSAKRRRNVSAASVHEAWEALERCWEEFDSFKYDSTSAYRLSDELIRFSDGWKIFLFEAQNIIRTNLEGRLARAIESQTSAFINNDTTTPDDIVGLQHLLDIAQSKCEVKTRQIVELVKRHVGTRFFEWDASLVRDGTYYAAMLLARAGGSDEDVAVCVRALNELRWAHAKAWDRSADLRREWAGSRGVSVNASAPVLRGWDPTMTTPSTAPGHHHHAHSKPSSSAPTTEVETPFTSPDIVSRTFDSSSSGRSVHRQAIAQIMSSSSASGSETTQHHHHPHHHSHIQHHQQPQAFLDQYHDHSDLNPFPQDHILNNNNNSSDNHQNHHHDLTHHQHHNHLGLETMDQKPWIPSLHGPAPPNAPDYFGMGIQVGGVHQQPQTQAQPPSQAFEPVNGHGQHNQQQQQQQQNSNILDHQHLAQSQPGQYVMQQDGSQVFVRYQ